MLKACRGLRSLPVKAVSSIYVGQCWMGDVGLGGLGDDDARGVEEAVCWGSPDVRLSRLGWLACPRKHAARVRLQSLHATLREGVLCWLGEMVVSRRV